MSKSKSFTLIELLVVVAIIGLMSSIMIINYSSQKPKDLEEQAVLQFVSDLRRAQNMAMTVVSCCSGEACDDYRLTITGPKKYQISCLQETNMQIEFHSGTYVIGDYIAFVPINTGSTTITITGKKSFTIGAKTINISDEGKITY